MAKKQGNLEFVFFSDLHAHQWTFGSKIEDGVYDRLYDHERVLMAIRDYCVLNKIETVIFGGDWYHSSKYVDTLTQDTMLDAAERLSQVLDRFLIDPGNHDYYFVDSRHCFAPYKHTAEIASMDDYVYHIKEGVKIRLLPYTKDSKIIRKFIESSDDKSINVMHLGLNDVSNEVGFLNKEETFSSKDLPQNSIINLLGHYHAPREIQKNKSYYVGAPLQLTWADANQSRGFYHVVIEDFQTKEVNFVPINNTMQFWEIDESFIKDEKEFKESIDNGVFDNSVIRYKYESQINDSYMALLQRKNENKSIRDLKLIGNYEKEDFSLKEGASIDSLNGKNSKYIFKSGIKGIAQIIKQDLQEKEDDNSDLRAFNYYNEEGLKYSLMRKSIDEILEEDKDD